MKIMEQEYHIPMEENFKEEVSIMCNLSQKIKETGIETGIEMGKREMIMKMYNKGYTAAQIADVAEMDEKKIKDIIKNAELLTVLKIDQNLIIQMLCNWMFGGVLR